MAQHKQKVPKQVREYWTFRDELVVIDGLILKGETIIVPQALRKDIPAQIHEGHLGIKRSKLTNKQVSIVGTILVPMAMHHLFVGNAHHQRKNC